MVVQFEIMHGFETQKPLEKGTNSTSRLMTTIIRPSDYAHRISKHQNMLK